MITKERIAGAVRVILGVGFLLLAVWGVLPTFTGRFHTGCMALITAGLLGVAGCVWYRPLFSFCGELTKRVGGRVLLYGVFGAACGLLLLFLAVSVGMVVAAVRPATEPNATVVVLGAALREDRPSTMLRGRLDAAAAYLKAHPDAVCVVSGGQGEDEICTEASVMQAYLLAAGIAKERIYLEENSRSTAENLQMSRRVIAENGLPEAVVIATQEFHQLRAQCFARRAGFVEVGAVTAGSPWYLLGSYWVRDFAGLCHMVVFGT